MKLKDLTAEEISRRVLDGRLCLHVGPFVFQIASDIGQLAVDLALLYSDFDVVDRSSHFVDFDVEVWRLPGVRRWVSPMARFRFDGRPYFPPLRTYQALAMLEWGLNWCVAAHAHQFLIVHAAVVERSGRAVLMPAPPGSGKSTLCAALIQRGWRLLSDELALCDLTSGVIYGMARPVNLKNTSIDVIRRFEPSVVLSHEVPNTTKGTVALLKPPAASVESVRVPAIPACVLMPKYAAGARTSLSVASKSRAYMLLAQQSFNYDVLAETGFKALGRLIDRCDCYQLQYSALDEAIDLMGGLLDRQHMASAAPA